MSTMIPPTNFNQGSMVADLPRLLSASRQRAFNQTPALDGLQGVGGPLHDPMWDAWFEAAQETNGGNPVGFSGRTQLGAQLRGVSAQPDYMTTNPTFQGRLNKDYQPTLFAPGQRSAITGLSYEDAQNHVSALKGLKNAKGY